MAAVDGTQHIVATPHSNDTYFYDRKYLSSLLERLRERVGDSPALSLGCDFHLSFENMQSALDVPQRYCIANSRYLLIEFSNFSIPQQIEDWMTQMSDRGIVPIITHPERNPLLQQNLERVSDWADGERAPTRLRSGYSKKSWCMCSPAMGTTSSAVRRCCRKPEKQLQRSLENKPHGHCWKKIRTPS